MPPQFANMTLAISLVQHRVPEAMRGRVMAIHMAGLIGFVPIVSLAGGVVADVTGIPAVLVGAGPGVPRVLAVRAPMAGRRAADRRRTGVSRDDRRGRHRPRGGRLTRQRTWRSAVSTTTRASAPITAGFATVAGPSAFGVFSSPRATSTDRRRAAPSLNLTTVSGSGGREGARRGAGPSRDRTGRRRAGPDAGAPPVDFFHAQPYPDWAAARRLECPVLLHGDTYQVTRYSDAESVLRDGETFSSRINAEHIGQFMGDLILAMDGHEHRQYRNLVAKAFRASQLERWEATLIRPCITRLVDAIAPPRAGRPRRGRDREVPPSR
ncbi:MAG: hypothetical protein KatS3mg010_1009 [Acidimicrobiia bacterium]|nr:MAG: hypothetical protein KatS3mg010_1009 [Acidimicrobiia bacterium]